MNNFLSVISRQMLRRTGPSLKVDWGIFQVLFSHGARLDTFHLAWFEDALDKAEQTCVVGLVYSGARCVRCARQCKCYGLGNVSRKSLHSDESNLQTGKTRNRALENNKVTWLFFFFWNVTCKFVISWTHGEDERHYGQKSLPLRTIIAMSSKEMLWTP